MIEITNAIKVELPNVNIIFVCSIPLLGLWNKDFYPNYLNVQNPSSADKYIANAQFLVDYYATIDEVTSKNYLLPQYFVTPTAEAINSVEQIDGARNIYHTPHGVSNSPHPNQNAHANWGYQLYSLIKYTMTL